MSDQLGPIPCKSYVNGCAAWTRTSANHHADERTGESCSCASMIVVLVLDQWSSTSPNLKSLSLADFAPCPYCVGRFGRVSATCEDCLGSGTLNPALSGNDAQAAVKIFGGERRLARVNPEGRPFLGTVWMRDDPATGKLVLFRANYDSSD